MYADSEKKHAGRVGQRGGTFCFLAFPTDPLYTVQADMDVNLGEGRLWVRSQDSSNGLTRGPRSVARGP